ncbi:MAG: hypothetical protein KatS3mg110_2397 [Pirellulaceae bacterium]|nr:MAG: hypothetical protein KatS3mg110_2397 [Pirellulaceae bacterium]
MVALGVSDRLGLRYTRQPMKAVGFRTAKRVKGWVRLMWIDWVAGLHLVLVNVGAGGPFLVAAMEAVPRTESVHVASWARCLLWLSLAGLLLGSVLGLLVGWHLWPHGLGTIVRCMPSKIQFGVWEWVFSVVCLVVQLVWWYRAPEATVWVRWVRAAVGVVGSTNLLYHFPVLFAVITELMHGGIAGGEVISASEFRRLLVTSSAGPRALHAAVASLGIGASALMMVAAWPTRRIAPYWIRWAAMWIAATTLGQWLIGFWVTTSLPPAAGRRLLGGSPLLLAVFVVCVLLALVITQLAARLCLNDPDRRVALLTAALVVLLAILMTWVSRQTMAPIRLPSESANHWGLRYPPAVMVKGAFHE